MWVTQKTDISKNRVDLESNVQEDILQSKANHKKDTCKNFFDETNPLYIETDTSGVGLEPLCYKQEVILAAQRMKLQTTTYSGPLHLLAKAWQEQKKWTTT